MGRKPTNWKAVVPLDDGGYEVRVRGKVPNAERSKEIVETTRFYTCVRCGRDNLVSRDFYTIRTDDDLFAGNDHLAPICKSCVDDILEKGRSPRGMAAVIFNLCAALQIPYVQAAVKNAKSAGNGRFDISAYIDMVTAPIPFEGSATNKTFASSVWKLVNSGAALTRLDQEKKGTPGLSVEDIAAQNTVISVMGTDPFSAYSKKDRTFLYGEMIKYFDDRIADDPYKLSQIAQIVLNNLQIHRYDMLLVDLDPINDTQKIVDINKIKSMLVQSNDKIAKENEISVRNRSDKEAGKGTLSALMKKLNEQGFTEAEANYYDQLLSEGTQWAIDESFKALQQNSFFDENDKQEIFLTQKKLIEDLQKQVDKVTEENRRLRVAIGERKEMKNVFNG